jgi:hypothetical protein
VRLITSLSCRTPATGPKPARVDFLIDGKLKWSDRTHARISGLVRLEAATTVPTPAVRLYLDGRLVQQAKRKPFAFALDVRKVVNGSHTLDLTTTDFLGRSAKRRIPVTVAAPTSG